MSRRTNRCVQRGAEHSESDAVCPVPQDASRPSGLPGPNPWFLAVAAFLQAAWAVFLAVMATIG
jgi:hypothetical protein